MLEKGVYHYKYMNIWERFNETFSMENITDADYKHAKMHGETLN